MFEDIVRDNWFYQYIMEQGLEEMRLSILDVVRARFPDVAGLAQQRVNAIHDGTLLRQVNMRMALASTAEEARHALLEIPPGDTQAGQAKPGSADLHAGTNGV